MAQKRINIPEIGEVVMQKRRGNRSMRLSVGNDGQVRLTMPAWAPYTVAQAFIVSKSAWLKTQLSRHQNSSLRHADRIGKAHTLVLTQESRNNILTRVADNKVSVRIPAQTDLSSQEVKQAINRAGVRALKLEAEQLLPQRLTQLADKHDFEYKSVTIKQLRGRWGSCDSQKNIVLNCYLMQLPWELIDYVILHELMHTRVLAHGPAFWDELGKHIGDLKAKRKDIKNHRPLLRSIKPASVHDAMA